MDRNRRCRCINPPAGAHVKLPHCKHCGGLLGGHATGYGHGGFTFDRGMPADAVRELRAEEGEGGTYEDGVMSPALALIEAVEDRIDRG